LTLIRHTELRRPGERRDPYAAASLEAGYAAAFLSIATDCGYGFLLSQERPQIFHTQRTTPVARKS